VPDTVTLVPLPAKRPELNPQENVWQFRRGNWLSNRVFTSHDTLVDHCCHAWNKLVEQPWTIMSIGPRDWRPARLATWVMINELWYNIQRSAVGSGVVHHARAMREFG